jgi:transcription antitermination factor NusG
MPAHGSRRRSGNLRSPKLFTAQWYAVRVKSRREYFVSEHLTSKGYLAFVPDRVERRQWSDRVKQARTPLISGYVFANFDASDLLPILRIPSVLYIVGSSRGPIAVSDEEIDTLKRIVESGVSPQPTPYLAAGSRVRIVTGPLQGVQGILVEGDAGVSQRLIVSVELLQRAVSVEVARNWLVPATRPARSEGLASANSNVH